MSKIHKSNQKIWFIAYTGSNPPHSYGVVENNQEMETGFQDLETFNNEADFLARASQLNIIIENS